MCAPNTTWNAVSMSTGTSGRPARGVAGIQQVMTALSGLSLTDKATFATLNVFGRNLNGIDKVTSRTGRDHYGNLTSLLLAGGGLKMGQVIGQSDRTASQPTTERYTPKNLLATVMNTILDVPEVRLKPGLGRVVNVLTESEPIPALT